MIIKEFIEFLKQRKKENQSPEEIMIDIDSLYFGRIGKWEAKLELNEYFDTVTKGGFKTTTHKFLQEASHKEGMKYLHELYGNRIPEAYKEDGVRFYKIITENKIIPYVCRQIAAEYADEYEILSAHNVKRVCDIMPEFPNGEKSVSIAELAEGEKIIQNAIDNKHHIDFNNLFTNNEKEQE